MPHLLKSHQNVIDNKSGQKTAKSDEQSCLSACFLVAQFFLQVHSKSHKLQFELLFFSDLQGQDTQM